MVDNTKKEKDEAVSALNALNKNLGRGIIAKAISHNDHPLSKFLFSVVLGKPVSKVKLEEQQEKSAQASQKERNSGSESFTKRNKFDNSKHNESMQLRNSV